MDKLIHQPCFKCGSSDAATYFMDTNVVSCFSCGENYKHPDTLTETKKAEVVPIQSFDFDSLPIRGFEERKITKPVSEAFNVRVQYDQNGAISHHLYPYTKRGVVKGHKTRELPKAFRFTGGSIREFEWMTNEQKVVAFAHFFNAKAPDMLTGVDFLTPGDFKAVAERALYEPEIPSAERLVELLEDEVGYKKKTMGEVMSKSKPKMGF